MYSGTFTENSLTGVANFHYRTHTQARNGASVTLLILY